MKNDDYLWDRSGEPDPDVQQLEEILGKLRYQPRLLEMPGAVNRFSKLYRGFAIAAAIALIAIGLSVWLGIQRRQTQEVTKTGSQPGSSEGLAAASPVDEKKVNGLLAENSGSRQIENVRPVDRRALSNSRNMHRRTIQKSMPAAEIAEGQAAKNQLMLALRVASSKLSYAQRKSQGNLVNNQHKIG